MLVLLAALVLHSAGWLLLAVLQVFLIAWLISGLAAILLIGRFRSRMRRAARQGYYRRQNWPGGHAQLWCAHWR